MSDELEIDLDDLPNSENKEAENTEVKQPENNFNAEVKEPYEKELKDKNKSVYYFSLPSVDIFTFSYKLNEFSKLNIDENNPDNIKWRKVNEEAVENYTPFGLYQERFVDPKSSFKQGIEKDGNLYGISNVKVKNVSGELEGEVALLKVAKYLGIGEIKTIPLPHSGIWVVIKPPTEKDLIDFYNSIYREKIYLGRMTKGLTLTNFSVYINNRLVDFILRHVQSVNYSDISVNELKNYILIYDLPILAWGFASTIYPNGFEYQRACVNDLEKCNYVAQSVINLDKLLWIDNNALTESQKNILFEYKPKKHTVDIYRKFITEHTRTVSHVVEIKEGLKIKLTIPTIAEYVSDGLSWVNKINDSIENIFLERNIEDDETKLNILDQYVKSSILRQFSHYIEHIEVDDSIITNRDTINKTLEILSSEDDIREKINTEVLKFKQDTTLALIGIPSYKCPKCGADQQVNPINENLRNVIPLDVMNLFFTLVTLRIARIMEREM